jgi:hypothetical protein
MHACKYIHTLLGCRPALEEFVAKFVDERGDRFVGEEGFRDEIWEYEWYVFMLSPEPGPKSLSATLTSFRRARFNWPSEAAEPYEDDPTNPNAAGPSSPVKSDSTGGTVDANHPTASTLELPAISMTGSVSANGLQSTTTTNQPRASDDFGGFSNEKLLQPTKSSPSSPNRQQSPLPPSVKSKMMHTPRNSRSASPVPFIPPPPFCSRKDSSELYQSMAEGNRAYKKLDDLVHLRSIRVFEGIKAA